jgi:hypothetical protein
MSIDIKELVIRARIDPKGEDKKPARKEEQGARQEIVAECVEQVLEILRQRRER